MDTHRSGYLLLATANINWCSDVGVQCNDNSKLSIHRDHVQLSQNRTVCLLHNYGMDAVLSQSSLVAYT